MFCSCGKCRKAAAALAGIGIIALPIHAYHLCHSETDKCTAASELRTVHPEEPVSLSATSTLSYSIAPWNFATATSSGEPALTYEDGGPILTFDLWTGDDPTSSAQSAQSTCRQIS